MSGRSAEEDDKDDSGGEGGIVPVDIVFFGHLAMKWVGDSKKFSLFMLIGVHSWTLYERGQQPSAGQQPSLP